MRIRGFEVVSRVEDIFDDAYMPKRSTSGSSGYDFFSYEDVVIPPSIRLSLKNMSWSVTPFLLKTGIKSYMGRDEELLLFNRSSNPKKLGLIVSNGVGKVDSDYYNNPDNEGEIGFLFYNILPFSIKIKKGDRIGQGTFYKWYKVDGDTSSNVRDGGFGSTGT